MSTPNDKDKMDKGGFDLMRWLENPSSDEDLKKQTEYLEKVTADIRTFIAESPETPENKVELTAKLIAIPKHDLSKVVFDILSGEADLLGKKEFEKIITDFANKLEDNKSKLKF